MIGPGEVVTNLVMRAARVDPLDPVPEPTDPSYLRYLKLEEFGIGIAWALVGGYLLVVILLAGIIGQQFGGAAGRMQGAAIGLGPSAFALAGAVLHWLRMIVLTAYQRVAYGGREPLLMDSIQAPGAWLDRVLTPTVLDIIFQLVFAVTVVLFALRVGS